MGEQFAQGLDTLIELVLFAELKSSVEAARELAIYFIHRGHLDRV
jgi:hypothetical protein